MVREQEFMDAEGRITDYNTFLECVFFHGLDPTARPLAWKFLLGYFPPESTRKEREALAEERR